MTKHDNNYVHLPTEPQNINVEHDAEPAHQREYVAEPYVEWCPSEAQRTKRGK